MNGACAALPTAFYVFLCNTGVVVHREKHASFWDNMTGSGCGNGGRAVMKVRRLQGMPSVEVDAVLIYGCDNIATFVRGGLDGITDLRQVPDAVQWAVRRSLSCNGARLFLSSIVIDSHNTYLNDAHIWHWIGAVIPVHQYLAYALINKTSAQQCRATKTDTNASYSPPSVNMLEVALRVNTNNEWLSVVQRHMHASRKKQAMHFSQCGLQYFWKQWWATRESVCGLQAQQNSTHVSTMDLCGAREFTVHCRTSVVRPNMVHAAQLTATCFAVLAFAMDRCTMSGDCVVCGSHNSAGQQPWTDVAPAMSCLREIMCGKSDTALSSACANKMQCPVCFAICRMVYEIVKLTTKRRLSSLVDQESDCVWKMLNVGFLFCTGLRFFENITMALDAHRLPLSETHGRFAAVDATNDGHRVLLRYMKKRKQTRKLVDAKREVALARMYCGTRCVGLSQISFDETRGALVMPHTMWIKIMRHNDPTLRMEETLPPVPTGLDGATHWGMGWISAMRYFASSDMASVQTALRWLQYNCYDCEPEPVMHREADLRACQRVLPALLNKANPPHDWDWRRFLWGFCAHDADIVADNHDDVFLQGLKHMGLFQQSAYVRTAEYLLLDEVSADEALYFLCHTKPKISLPLYCRRRPLNMLWHKLGLDADAMEGLRHATLVHNQCLNTTQCAPDTSAMCRVFRVSEAATYFGKAPLMQEDMDICTQLKHSVCGSPWLFCGAGLGAHTIPMQNLYPFGGRLLCDGAVFSGSADTLPFSGAHPQFLNHVLYDTISEMDADTIIATADAIYATDNFADFLHKSGSDITMGQGSESPVQTQMTFQRNKNNMLLLCSR